MDDDASRLRTLVGGETFGGRFEIVALAGSGGMGKVFEAIDRTTGGRVALKVVTGGGDRERFAVEARVLESLAHPAIVRYVCHGVTAEGHPYLAMEWLRAESLSTRLRRGKLTLADAVTVGERLADALAYAHGAGVIHRDLKPSNVFLVEGGFAGAHLIDFGVAKQADTRLTATGQMVGTPGYMAPEQVRGDKTVAGSADVFALGCVLYECLAGTPAFEGGQVAEVLSRLLLEAPERLEQVAPDVPPRVVQLVDAMLVKDAEARLADCAVVRDELRALAAAIAAGDRDSLTTRSPIIPVVAPETLAGKPTFRLAAHERPTLAHAPTVARRPPAVKKRGSGLWIALGIAGAIGGSALGAYLVLRDDGATPAGPRADAAVSQQRVTCDARNLPLCKTECEGGNNDSCNIYGALHIDELEFHVPALEAFERACKRDDPTACTNVAWVLLEDPELSHTGKRRARSLFEAACAKRLVVACFQLANESRPRGRFETDERYAFESMERLCSQDKDAQACRALRQMVTGGVEGSRRMRARAEAVVDEACKQGVPDSC